jgi:Tol biopolymer transport system component
MNIWRLPLDPATAKPSGEPQPVTAGVAASAHYPSLSKDGRRLAFSVSTESGNIARIRFNAAEGRVVGEPEALTRGTNAYAAPDVSPNGELVTFCTCFIRPGVDENIYVARADGSELLALTSDEGHSNRLPRWTADGKRILFYSNRSGDWEIWSIAPDGSGLKRVTDTPGKVTLFTVPEPSGTRVIAWINMGGLIEIDLAKPFNEQTLKTIAPYPEPEQQFLPAAWSPRADILAGWVDAHGESAGVYTYDLASEQYRKIVDNGRAPRWLGDGKRLVYTSEKGRGLWLVDVTAPQPQDLLHLHPDDISAHISVSRDERWIYFTRVTEDGDVWLAELD